MGTTQQTNWEAEHGVRFRVCMGQEKKFIGLDASMFLYMARKEGLSKAIEWIRGEYEG